MSNIEYIYYPQSNYGLPHQFIMDCYEYNKLESYWTNICEPEDQDVDMMEHPQDDHEHQFGGPAPRSQVCIYFRYEKDAVEFKMRYM